MGRRIKRVIQFIVNGIAVILMLSLLLALCSPYINPFYCWTAGLFGLAYPAIWSVSLLYSFLLIRRRNWFLIMLIPILAGTPMMLKHFSLPLNAGNKTTDNYSIISYNVHGFAGNDNGKSSYERQFQVHEFVNSLNPSVVCMQEYAMKGNRHARYLEHLNTGLKLPNKHISSFDEAYKGTSYTYLTSTIYPVRHEGIIFTIESELCGIYTDIDFPEGTIRVFNIHLQSVKLHNEKLLLRPHKELPAKKNIINYVKITIVKLRTAFRIRSYQALAIAESVRKSPYPVIVAGDFNDTPASFSYRIIKKGLNDAVFKHGTGFQRTYAESLYPIRIDHILVSEKLRINHYTRHKIWLSDHFPVSASFGFKK